MNPGRSKVEKAMRKGLVDVVDKMLGEAPTHVYDYGMQPEWIKSARQWVADKRRPQAIHPIHCWSAGYGGPQSPMTWFRCTGCNRTSLGSPHEEPTMGCLMCAFDGKKPAWEVADRNEAFVATSEITKDMPTHSVAAVLEGPR